MKKIIIFLITIVLSLAVGIGGTYYYMSSKDKEISKVDEATKKESKEENKAITNLDVYSDIVQNNFSKLLSNTDCKDLAKEYLKETKVTSVDISNSIAYEIVAATTSENKNAISESEWKNEVAKLFGKDYKYDPTSFQDSNYCASHTYNSSTKQYEYREEDCGCTTGPNAFILQYVTKAELEGDTLTIYLKALFPDNSATSSTGYAKYYSDSAKTKEIFLDFDNYIYDATESEPVYSVSNIEKGGSYKIVMKKYQGNDYYFVSSEPINN